MQNATACEKAAMPSARRRAFQLGVRLLVAAANPWSGLTREYARLGPMQPADPYGQPEWWPVGVFRVRPASVLRRGLITSSR